MTRQHFHQLVAGLTRQLAGRPLDAGLEHWLNRHHGPGSTLYEALREDCLTGLQEGWACDSMSGGLAHGRVFRPADELQRFSVDMMDMNNQSAPHHRHPQGEICLVVPLSAGARYEGRGAGWCVFEPGSAHSPRVCGGRALVMAMLPDGRIELSRAAA